jgi:hypothetical protein
MLIPDGSGAQIDYQSSVPMTNAYQQPYYGADYGVVNPPSARGAASLGGVSGTVNSLTVPAYGIVNGTDAMLSYVKSGAEYGQLNASKAGLQTDFNWITSKFAYRSAFNQPISKSDTSGVKTYSAASNPVDIDIVYDFVSGEQANYVGLASALQKELVSQGILHKQQPQEQGSQGGQQGGQRVMSLNFLGAAQAPGLFANKLNVLTTADDISQTLKSLGDSGMATSLTGFTKGGYDNSMPNAFPQDDSVGSQSAFQNLATEAKKSGNSFSLDVDYGQAPSQPSDIADNGYMQQINGFTQQYAQAAAYPELVKRDIASFKQLGVSNVNVSTIGQILYSDYQNGNAKDFVSRTAAMKYQDEALSALQKAGISLTADNPNLYAWKYLSAIDNLPSSDSRFIYETQAVPFVQTVLHGYIDYSSAPANEASNQNDYLLTNIAIGAAPSYTLTQAPSADLAKTEFSSYYNTQVSNWMKQLKSDNAIYSALAEATAGATIVSQEHVAPAVLKVTYSNGAEVYVNTGDMDYRAGSVQVKAQGYAITTHSAAEGGKQ